jgi:C-terminal processing protease CtpA/Prc
MINSQQDLSQLTKHQLDQLAWQLKGTPEVQPVYQEITQRVKAFVKPDDPEWEAKLEQMLSNAFTNS